MITSFMELGNIMTVVLRKRYVTTHEVIILSNHITQDMTLYMLYDVNSCIYTPNSRYLIICSLCDYMTPTKYFMINHIPQNGKAML